MYFKEPGWHPPILYQGGSTYGNESGAWDDTPLYIFDEWISYMNEGAVGVDQVKAGKWNAGWRDAVAGVIDFNVYAIATAML